MKRNITLGYIYNFINRLNMQNCIWVLYLRMMGMSLTQIGILEGMYHVTSIICEVPSGAVADMLGRKRTMIAGRICVFLSCLLMLFGRDFYAFAISFIIQAFGNNLNSGADEALIYDSMKQLDREEEYIRVSGKNNTLMEISSSLATVIGGILAKQSYQLCYATSAVLGALVIAPIMGMKEPVLTKRNQNLSVMEMIRQHFGICFSVLKENQKLTRLILFFNSLEVAVTVLFFYSQEYYHSMGLDEVQISMIMLVMGILSTSGAFLSDRIYEKLGKKALVFAVIAICVAIVGYFFYNLWIGMVCFGVCSFVSAVLYPIRSASINKLIPSEQRATLISVDSLVFSMGMVIIFPAVGFVVEHL